MNQSKQYVATSSSTLEEQEKCSGILYLGVEEARVVDGVVPSVARVVGDGGPTAKRPQAQARHGQRVGRQHYGLIEV